MTTSLAPSAHQDTFCRDHLPPAADWPELVFDLPDVQYGPRLNCAVALLDDTLERLGPDRPCLLTPDAPAWSYGRLRTVVDGVAHVLVAEAGIVSGNRVLLRGPNNPWLVACWLAVQKAGAVAVTTVPLLRAVELDAIDDVAQVDLVLCDTRFVDEVQRSRLAATPLIVYGGGDAHDLAQRAAARSQPFVAVDTAADDVSMLAFTSGTTGRPKATMHFHRDVLAMADTFGRYVVQPRPDDVFTGTPPLGFTFGLGGLAVFPLRAGAATLLVERATPGELVDIIAEHGVTVCFTAPTAYRAMLAGGSADRLRSLRRAVSAGEHLPLSTWEAFERATGVRLIDGIGSTEMLHVFISASDDDIRPGCTGTPVPGYRAVILDDAGESVPDGTPGRLAVKGPTGCRYLDDPRQADYVQHGWNITGDTFVREADGYFRYLARNDDMIVSSGYNIAAPEVEDALGGHAAVAECCVVGVPDVARGQLVKAYVVAAPDAVTDAALMAELQAFVKQRIAPYKYPRDIEFVAQLPRTSTGKIRRTELRERAAGLE